MIGNRKSEDPSEVLVVAMLTALKNEIYISDMGNTT